MDLSGKAKWDVMGCQHCIPNYTPGRPCTWLPPEELIFTEDDILSFNLTTREILFVDSCTADKKTFFELVWYHPIYNIYLGENLLFENIPYHNGCGLYVVNDLVFYLQPDPILCLRVILNDGEPQFEEFIVPDVEFKKWCQSEQEKNAEKRKVEQEFIL